MHKYEELCISRIMWNYVTAEEARSQRFHSKALKENKIDKASLPIGNTNSGPPLTFEDGKWWWPLVALVAIVEWKGLKLIAEQPEG